MTSRWQPFGGRPTHAGISYFDIASLPSFNELFIDAFLAFNSPIFDVFIVNDRKIFLFFFENVDKFKNFCKKTRINRNSLSQKKEYFFFKYNFAQSKDFLIYNRDRMVARIIALIFETTTEILCFPDGKRNGKRSSENSTRERRLIRFFSTAK